MQNGRNPAHRKSPPPRRPPAVPSFVYRQDGHELSMQFWNRAYHNKPPPVCQQKPAGVFVYLVFSWKSATRKSWSFLRVSTAASGRPAHTAVRFRIHFMLKAERHQEMDSKLLHDGNELVHDILFSTRKGGRPNMGSFRRWPNSKSSFKAVVRELRLRSAIAT